MKILVTGAAGFIGSYTSEFLLQRGDEVVGIDELNDYYDLSIKEENLSLLHKYPNFRFHKRDICDKTFIDSLFESEKFEVVCHLAARAGVRPSIADPLLYVHSNVEGTVVLLEAARKNNIKNFVFASSSSVYGDNTKAPFSEEDRVDNPVSPYAATKKSCELLAYTYWSLYRFPISALRFFTVYGPRGRPDMAPFLFVDSIYKGKKIQQFGDGSSRRDYTFISDILSGIIGAIDHPRNSFEVYNLGRGQTITLSDFISTIEELLGKKANIEILPPQKGDVPLTFADVKKAKECLGFDPQVSTRDGLKKTIDWYIGKYGNKEQ